MTLDETHSVEATRPRWFQPEAIALVLLVAATYFTRITALPVVGEEGRWARGAMEMLATGDWVVWRQQGQVFPEKPPLVCWAMAAVGLVHGKVDALAIRLPSVLALLLTSLVVYVYARTFVSRASAFAAGAVYASMGQVLEIGRQGEAESLFTLFVSASLLGWHMGYARRWPAATVWLIGYALAAMGALVKGPQAPVYFISTTAVFLCHQRQWRWLFGWQHALGIFGFLTIVGAWQIPYYFATDWNAVVATWVGLTADRFTLRGMLEHMVTYPLETFVCLLPWSPFLLVAVHPRARQLLNESRVPLTFLVIALLVTYPTVWFASGARGRYYMPLYPCLAVVIALVMRCCARATPGTPPRRDWNRILAVMAGVFAVVGVLVVGVNVIGGFRVVALPSLDSFRQPPWLVVLCGASSGLAVLGLVRARRVGGENSLFTAAISVSAFTALLFTGVVVNIKQATWNNPGPTIAGIRQRLPDSARLVSFGPIDHRFAYFYETQIRELTWPTAPDHVPADVTYFCFNRYPGDTKEHHPFGRGRTWWSVAGSLPVAWEEVATVCVERRRKQTPQPEVVVARIVRHPETAILEVPADLQRR